MSEGYVTTLVDDVEEMADEAAGVRENVAALLRGGRVPSATRWRAEQARDALDEAREALEGLAEWLADEDDEDED